MVDWVYDEVVLAADLAVSKNWRARRAGEVEVTWLSGLLRSRSEVFHPGVTLPPTSRSRNSVQRKTYDIVTADAAYTGKPTRHSKLDVLVAAEFRADPEGMHVKARAIRRALENRQLIEELRRPFDEEDEGTEEEGGILESLVRRRERSRKLRIQKLDAVKSAGGKVACEVCGFDFAAKFGARGAGYIEVHHVMPLHVSGETQTALEDLALLCANCHRMCHRSPWTDPSSLRGMLEAQQSAHTA